MSPPVLTPSVTCHGYLVLASLFTCFRFVILFSSLLHLVCLLFVTSILSSGSPAPPITSFPSCHIPYIQFRHLSVPVTSSSRNAVSLLSPRHPVLVISLFPVSLSRHTSCQATLTLPLVKSSTQHFIPSCVGPRWKDHSISILLHHAASSHHL